MLAHLKAFSEDTKRNTVVVVSGRSREQLEQLCGRVCNLHIIAEDGYWYAEVEDPNLDLRLRDGSSISAANRLPVLWYN